jgi:integrase
VDVGPETVNVLANLDRTSEFVFPSRLGNPLDPTAATQRVKRFTNKVLGESWTPHEMRHSCASLLVSGGVGIKVVSDMLGHSSVTLTANTYSHLTPEARSETARAFSALLDPNAM